jgi:hypothetical protein
MQKAGSGRTVAVLGAIITLLAPLSSNASQHIRTSATPLRAPHPVTYHPVHGRIAPTRTYSARNAAMARTVAFAPRHNNLSRHAWRSADGVALAGGGLQCVPFARDESGIDIIGNANTWWSQASGLYERGHRPEVGSVLTFRPVHAMPLGHVAVVTRIDGPREVEIDHANWPGPGGRFGTVTRNVPVVDVSPNNDWTAVRVGLVEKGEFGSIYPTYGFIYDRADHGTMLAAKESGAAVPDLNPAPRDLRPVVSDVVDEVAEAPEPALHHHAARHRAHASVLHHHRR